MLLRRCPRSHWCRLGRCALLPAGGCCLPCLSCACCCRQPNYHSAHHRAERHGGMAGTASPPDTVSQRPSLLPAGADVLLPAAQEAARRGHRRPQAQVRAGCVLFAVDDAGMTDVAVAMFCMCGTQPRSSAFTAHVSCLTTFSSEPPLPCRPAPLPPHLVPALKRTATITSRPPSKPAAPAAKPAKPAQPKQPKANPAIQIVSPGAAAKIAPPADVMQMFMQQPAPMQPLPAAAPAAPAAAPAAPQAQQPAVLQPQTAAAAPAQPAAAAVNPAVSCGACRLVPWPCSLKVQLVVRH